MIDIDSDDTAPPSPAPHHQPHGHQASLKDGLAFVNTLEFDRGKVIERLPGVITALLWFRDHSLLHEETLAGETHRFTADEAAGERTLRRVHRVRSAIRELLVATVERRPPGARELDEMNRALRFHYVTYLVPAPDGVSLDHKHEGDPIEGALARLAESVARELTTGRPERLRVCENQECRWVFLDTSHSGKRKWCDMRTCGNRVKVARHRQRRREEGQGDGTDASITSRVVAPSQA
jgi:predicted RNA-binding Zn ribbon-like protein